MPAIENQRVSFAILAFQYTADDDLVITAIVAIHRSTFEGRRKLRQNRNAGNAVATFQTVKLIGSAGRKLFTNILLVCCEYIDRKMLSGDERAEALGVLADTPEH